MTIITQTTLTPAAQLEWRLGDVTEDRDGDLYIVSQDFYDDKPIMYRNFYPTSLRTAQVERNHGKPIVGLWLGQHNQREFTWTDSDGFPRKARAWLSREYGGVYRLCRVFRDYGAITYLRIDLPQGGSTKATFQEHLDVPRPPARGKELRWYRGQWQRLLKNGWVSA